MDRKWFQIIIQLLNIVLVKGVVKAAAAILGVQVVMWLWNGAWPHWTVQALFHINDLSSLEPPAALKWVVSFFINLPLFLFVPLAGWAAVGLFYLSALLVVSALVQTSAFFRQFFFRKRSTPPKHIAICTDGTWNYPENLEGGVINGTNVFKFWQLLEGKRRHSREIWVGANRLKTHVVMEPKDGKSRKVIKQMGLYYNGVGNKAEHTQLGIVLGGAFGMGAKRIVKNAYRDLIRHYRDGDTISICGFSRGAAIARLIAGRIGSRGLPRYAISDLPFIRLFAVPIAKRIGTLRRPNVDLLGVWDTVGAFGVSKSIMGIPFQRINLFKDLSVGNHVTKTVHMLALDEERDSFIPTLITPSPNRDVEEIWFAGNHSNVGGGYAGNTMSNIPLRHFCMVAKHKGALPLLTFRSKEDLLAQDAKRKIAREAKLAKQQKLREENKQKLRQEDYALFGFDNEDELAPVLYPEEGFEKRIERDANDEVRREDSPVYENAPRVVPDNPHTRLDDSVRYKMVSSCGDYQPRSVMLYLKNTKAFGERYLEMRRALLEGGHITKEDFEMDEALIKETGSLRHAFKKAEWLPSEPDSDASTLSEELKREKLPS